MPYTAITPFRRAVQHLLDNPYPRPADPEAGDENEDGSARRRLEFSYQGTVATYHIPPPNPPNPPPDPKTDPYTIRPSSTMAAGYLVNWQRPSHRGIGLPRRRCQQP